MSKSTDNSLRNRRKEVAATSASTAADLSEMTFRDINWEDDKEVSAVNELWGEGFALIINLYWREIIISKEYLSMITAASLLITYLARLLPLVFMSLYAYYTGETESLALLSSFAPAWDACLEDTTTSAIWFLSTFPIFPIGYYLRMYFGVHAHIRTGGVRAGAVDYTKFIVCEHKSRIIACVGLKAGESIANTPAKGETDVCSIWRLTVASDYRRYGLGRVLMDQCEEIAKANGFRYVRLLAGNIASIKFYDRLGYRRVSLAWRRGRHESINFEKDLGAGGDVQTVDDAE
jgi:ribosomal protein S18 acetylase RimI-like enzyme